MPGVARQDDVVTGTCFHSSHTVPFATTGTITTFSSDVKVNQKGVARDGDTVTASCGHTGTINTFSGTVNANTKGFARLGDNTVGDFIGTVTSASGNVNTL